MKQQFPLFQLLLAFLIASFSFLTAYPQGEWKWAHAWTGSGGNPTYNQIFNNITNTAFDEEGNIYVYGSIGGSPELDGQHFLTDVPAEVQNPANKSILLAKFDTTGNMLWHKIVKCSGYDNVECVPGWMEVHDGKVFVMGSGGLWGYHAGTWLYYMDTLIRKDQLESIPEGERRPPFKQSQWTWFAQFDLDGNLQEDHFVEAYSREKYLNGTTYIRAELPLCRGTDPMHVDRDGNTFLYAGIGYTGSAEDPFTIVIDGDTNRKYDIYLPRTGQEGAIVNLQDAMLYKFSQNWELVYAKRVVDHTEGIAASWEYLRDSVNPYYGCIPVGLSFDEDDNMYLSGCFCVTMNDYDNGGHLHQYPIHVYWDSTHYATIYDMSGADRLNFIIKYNTDSEVQWCNQIYTKGRSTGAPYARATWKDNCNKGNYLYLIGDGAYTPGGQANIYFATESDSLHRYVPHDAGIGFFVKYNKNTGQYILHGIVPAENVLNSKTPTVLKNRVFSLSSFDYESNCLFTEWCDNSFVIMKDTINSLQPRMNESYGVTANEDGSLLLSLLSYAPVTFSESVVAISNPGIDNAVFALYKNPEWATPYVGVPDRGGQRGDLKLWPNPAGRVIHVECAQSLIDYVTIMDLNGRTLMREVVSGNSAAIDVSRLPAGTYILETVGKGDVQTEKFVKTN